jgi:hypothetical protein
MIEEMLKQANVMFDGLLKNDELFEKIAKLEMKLVRSLMKEGFTQEEAVRIAASQGNFFKMNG